MAIDILVPPLSQTMDTVVLVAWLKKPGDSVTKGETLYQIETDKATMDIESPGSGILQETLAKPGDEVEVRSKIGTIAIPDEVSLQQPAETPKVPARQLPGVPSAVIENMTTPGGETLPEERQTRIFATPRARHLAKQADLSLTDLRASGPQGMIVERDVQAFLEQRKAAVKATPVARRVAEHAGVDLRTVKPAVPGGIIQRADVEATLQQNAAQVVLTELTGQLVDITPTRRTIAQRMQTSHQTTAPVTLMRYVDATELVSLRARIMEEISAQDVRPTYTDFLINIVARCLRRHPGVNAHFDGETYELYDEIHIALAVDTQRGLVVPVIRHADHKSLLELTRQRTDLTQCALDGTITPDDLSGGTFTITNLGSLGIDAFTPIINPPQIAILGVGRIRPVPAAFEGQVAIRQMMFLSLTFDHRIVDGAPAARLLHDIAQLIEKPHLVWL